MAKPKKPKKRSSPAQRFLWVVAGLTMLFIAGAVAYRIFEQELMRWAMIPKGEFQEVPLPAGHGPEVIVDVSVGFSGGACGLLPPTLGLLIDDLRTE